MKRSDRMFGILELAAALLLGVLVFGATGAAAATPMQASDLIAMVAAGKRVPDGTTVAGALDLRDRDLTHPLECSGCTFTGPVLARDAIFERTVNLSGSTFEGPVSFQGATFRAPAVFGSPGSAGTTFAAPADFTLATFDDLAGFNGVTFAKAATFDLARFRSTVVFSDSHFAAEAKFNSAVFGGDAQFDASHGVFAGDAAFRLASFGGAADFHGRTFCSAASFESTNFGGHVDFSGTLFRQEAAFGQANFAGEAVFRQAKFFGLESTDAADFNRVRGTGTLDFGSANLRGDMLFTNVTAGGLVLAGAIYSPVDEQVGLILRKPCGARPAPTTTGSVALDIQGLATPDFSIDLNQIGRVVPGERMRALALVEASAKAKDDLGLANDAHYDLRSLKSHGYAWPVHALDFAFYRSLAGYLVRPLQPLLTMFVLAVLFTLWYSLRRPRDPQQAAAPTPTPPPKRQPRRLLGRRPVWHAVSQYLHELLDTFMIILPRGGGSTAGRRFEAVAYRILFVCMLLGFANSNPTLRQMLDALL